MKRREEPDLRQEDEGETIVNMNVEGMPWYLRREESAPNAPHQQMTKEELRMYRWAALKAGLLIALIFGVIFALFIAFCDFVWFR
jgi:hypothetical protein